MSFRKIIIASDSFKGCLSSLEVADAIAAGLDGHKIVRIEIADGGEGTAETLTRSLGGRTVGVMVHDPAGRRIMSSYGILPDGTAVLDLASASGLTLLAPEERNPMRTSTFGTGEMILDALGRGCRKFMMGIGGSATNDAGTGMLAALGFRFLDSDGKAVDPCGANLSRITEIDGSGAAEELAGAGFTVACDVDNPFFGPSGASEVFAPQKGASKDEVAALEAGMTSFAEVLRKSYGEVGEIAGAGAAGGVGGAMALILGATLKRGIDMILDISGFDREVADADLVITGEGKIDAQTARGKAPAGVLERTRRINPGARVWAIGGRVETCPEVEALGFDRIVEISAGLPESEAMDPAKTAGRLLLLSDLISE